MSSSFQSLRDFKKKKKKKNINKANVLLIRDFNLPLGINSTYNKKTTTLNNSNSLFRCVLTGRSGSVLTKYKLTRMAFKCLGSSGLIPGVTKSSF
jgi:ribosomal protein S14